MARRKTHEEYIAEVLEKRGDAYQVISTYKGAKSKVKVLHKTCGSTYEIRADGLLAGTRCRECVYDKMTKTHEEYVKQVKEVHKDEYEVVSEYTWSHGTVDILHNKCGRVRTVNANSVLQGKRCVYCYNESRIKTQEEFEQDVYNLVGEEYKVVDKYTMAKEPITFLHNDPDCMSEFKATPNSFLSGGNRCPHCAYSKGEDNIRHILDTYGITYEREKEFDDLINIRPLRFDFYIEEYNLLIEFDGEQHEKPIPHFGGEEYYQYIKENDEKKNRYCKDNNINLLRIPYKEINNEEQIILNYIEQIKIKQLLDKVMGKVMGKEANDVIKGSCR